MHASQLKRPFLLMLGAVMLVSSAPSAALASPGRAAQPPKILAKELGGEQAVAALGNDVAIVAARHRTTPGELKRALRSDKSLRVNPQGQLLYREAALPAEEAALPEDTTPWDRATGYPLEDTFRLHSKPGSRRTIYLDFDGQLLQGSAWNGSYLPASIACPPWDIGGDPAVFDPTERAKIQQVWQRVSEDYAPFDVDVTTEVPDESALTRSDASDDVFGMRVLVSPISAYFGNYGGVAFVDMFDAVGDTYKPALVFPENLAHRERSIAEAISHEAGHTLGLLHDGTTAGVSYYRGSGTGVTSWAPIMGTSYSQNVTQWSRGEYPLANNLQDDLAVIAGGGAPLGVDDHSNALGDVGTATNGPAFSARGVVSGAPDVDVVPFRTGDGLATVRVAPAAVGANLDVRLEVRDSAGAVVGVAEPVDALDATVSVTLSPGTYYAYISGSGAGDPAAGGYSSYGSVGAWTLSGTVADPGTNVPPTVAISSSATTGVAPASFTLDASLASDPEGGPLTWRWDLGNGTTAEGAVVEPLYESPGVYTATVTVTDNAGATSRASVQLTVVAPNVAPTAAFRMTGAGSPAPALGTFDGSSSSDPDGAIVRYSWDFGDGTGGTGAWISHQYRLPGMYRVALTVEDDRGAVSTTISDFVVAPSSQVLHVDRLSLTVTTSKSSKVARVAVRVTDESGQPVSGATVTGSFTGAVSSTSSGITGTDGSVVISSKAYRKTGIVTFTVNSLSKSDWVYDASQNVATRVSGI